MFSNDSDIDLNATGHAEFDAWKWGDEKTAIKSVIKFEFIDSSKSKNIIQNNQNIQLELLAIDIFKREHNFEIILLFSKNRFITLSTEIVDVTLEDQNLKDDKSN